MTKDDLQQKLSELVEAQKKWLASRDEAQVMVTKLQGAGELVQEMINDINNETVDKEKDDATSTGSKSNQPAKS